MRAVDTHALIATLADGRKIEIGRVRSLERAVRLRAALQAEHRDEYVGFEFLELEEETPSSRSLTYDEIRAARRRLA